MHSWGADALINGGTLSRTDARKLFQCTALLVPALCMTALAMGDHSPSEAQVRGHVRKKLLLLL